MRRPRTASAGRSHYKPRRVEKQNSTSVRVFTPPESLGQKRNRQNMSYHTHLSEREIPLVYILGFADKPVITVENYPKWYGLYLVMPNRTIKKWEDIPFQDDNEFVGKSNESAYCDHAFNPKYVQFLAEKYDYILCDQSLEILIGRWEMEYKENY